MASGSGRYEEEGAFARERTEPPADDRPISELINGLISDGQALVRREIDLAKQEIGIEIDKARDGMTALGAGVAVAAIAGVLLTFMLVYLISDLTGIALWISYLIVGALFAIIGGVLVKRGLDRVKQIDPVPHETIESVRKDVEWITEQNQSDRT